MFAAALAFLTGNLFLHQFTELPEWQAPLWLVALSIVVASISRRLPLKMLLWVLTGALFTLHFAQQRLSERLPSELAGIDIDAIGIVSSIPMLKEEGAIRFRFEVEQAIQKDKPINLPELIRISWYHNMGEQPKAGERWQLRVRLKPPNGSLNPGGFDYEKWLFQEAIGATGYVRSSEENNRLDDVPGYSLAAIRTAIYNNLVNHTPDTVERGVLIALALGERRDISPEQWSLFFNTGTNHLVAISGLHIGLVAGLIFLLIRWGWGWLPQRWGSVIAAPRIAAIVAMIIALLYAALAGFSIPTQRALLMLVLAFGAIVLQRPVRPVQLLSFALLMVLLLDPFASLSVGFWLSFAAVALIFAGINRKDESKLIRYGKIQWLLFLGLAPLLILFFGRVSLLAPIANLMAVPWVSLWVVPLTLLGVVLLPLSTGLAELVLYLASKGMSGLSALLTWLDGWIEPLAVVPANDWLLVPAAIGIAILLFYKRWQRSMGLFGLLPLVLINPAQLQHGEARFTLLDVGQGLAAVVETRDHTLIFDTGARYHSGFNFGDAAILPYLRYRGLEQIDTLVVSHGDNDHIGGAKSLYDQTKIVNIMTSVPEMLPWGDEIGGVDGIGSRPCNAGEQWAWDGVRFEFLHPQSLDLPLSENNLSCVLKVATLNKSVLLTGDIESQAEKIITDVYGVKLRADILVAPHHGSKTSSSQSFIELVAPEWVLFPVGYRNRYHFPHQTVVARYQNQGSQILHSDRAGAISFKLCEKCPLNPQRFRQQERRYWHNIEYD